MRKRHRKKLLLVGDKTRRLWVWRIKIFLMKINVNACTLEDSSHIFSSVSGKLPPRKFPPGMFPPMLLNIPTRVCFFFIIVAVIIWYYLKDCFVILCFKSAEVFTFVKICQSEVLSEERQLMKWVGIFQVRIFWVVVFCGWNFPARSLIGGNFLGGNSPRADFPGNIFFI